MEERPLVGKTPPLISNTNKSLSSDNEASVGATNVKSVEGQSAHIADGLDPVPSTEDGISNLHIGDDPDDSQRIPWTQIMVDFPIEGSSQLSSLLDVADGAGNQTSVDRVGLVGERPHEPETPHVISLSAVDNPLSITIHSEGYEHCWSQTEIEESCEFLKLSNTGDIWKHPGLAKRIIEINDPRPVAYSCMLPKNASLCTSESVDWATEPSLCHEAAGEDPAKVEHKLGLITTMLRLRYDVSRLCVYV